ncbi:hypothetical protein SAMN05216167_101293 [Spirosoma endophyticum]|uniref:Uncharacterized protein n=1 Tax=Spirosoma endophyticum TaxID=662367 RepID=A0A1I1FRD6_9BACT|nr:hypothetical protein SAMN05216167_101293 [Spirosoma endophyticum]
MGLYATAGNGQALGNIKKFSFFITSVYLTYTMISLAIASLTISTEKSADGKNSIFRW